MESTIGCSIKNFLTLIVRNSCIEYTVNTDTVEIPAKTVIDGLVDGAVDYARDSFRHIRFNLDGERLNHSPNTLPEQFHISVKSLAFDSQLPEFEKWCDACTKEGDLEQFARDAYNELEEHEFTTSAVSYEKEYRNNSTRDNRNVKQVKIKIIK